MANQFENYLNRLRNIKANRPEMRVYEKSISKLAQPYNILNRKMASLTQRGGASTASQVAALNEGRNQWNELQRDSYGTAVESAGKREEALDLKIADVEMQNEQYKDQQRKEKAAKRSGILRTVLSAVGMGAGALLAAPTGGMSMLLGSALGGAIGQTASGFMGINKDGNLSLDPDEWDIGAIEQGLTSTVQSLATNANQAEMKGKMGMLSDNAGAYSKYIDANPGQAAALQFQLENIMLNGSQEDLSNWFNTILGGM